MCFFFSLLPCSLCPQPAPWLSIFPSLMACTKPSFLKCHSSVTLPLLVCNDCTLTFTPGYGTISKQNSLDSQLSPSCPHCAHQSYFPLKTAINPQSQYNNLLLSSWFSGTKSPKRQSLNFQVSETMVVSTGIISHLRSRTFKLAEF